MYHSLEDAIKLLCINKRTSAAHTTVQGIYGVVMAVYLGMHEQIG